MGGAKRLMAEREEICRWAEGMLIEHGAASECENHGYVTHNLDIADWRRLTGGGGLGGSGEPVRRMTADDSEAAVRDTLNYFGDDCPGCNSRD